MGGTEGTKTMRTRAVGGLHVWLELSNVYKKRQSYQKTTVRHTNTNIRNRAMPKSFIDLSFNKDQLHQFLLGTVLRRVESEKYKVD